MTYENPQVSTPAVTEPSTRGVGSVDNLSPERPRAGQAQAPTNQLGNVDNLSPQRAHTDQTQAPTTAPGRTRNGAPDLVTHQLHVALTWLQRGHPVVPCGRDKAALVPGFGKDATADQLAPFSDPDQARAWWTGRYKRAHVGLLTRRLVVIDLDQSKTCSPISEGRWAGCMHGTDVLERLGAEAGTDWPETYTVLTPSGGMHLYFGQPTDGGPLIGCATGDGTRAPHLGPMVDVRGVGGYVIAAGSYSPSQGRVYERVSPASLQPQPLPAWLLSLLRPDARPAAAAVRPAAPVVRQLPTGDRAERYAAAALQRLVDDVAAAPDGARWRTLSGAALRLAELSPTAPRVLDYATVLDALTGAAATAGMSGGYERAERAVRTAWESRAGRGGGAA